MAAEGRRTSDYDRPAVQRAVGEGRTLAAAMPRLILEARRVAATVIHGLHGRRRAGPGENFWQYRRFVSGEPASRVDWRRSARDDHLYVRELEWEAAHTVWIWPDRSPSMVFASPLVRDTKLYRALVIALALAEVLVEGGERVGIPGLMRPTGSRNVIQRMAQAIVHDRGERNSLPPNFSPSPLAEIVLLSDFWSDIADVRRTITQLSGSGARGHVVQIVDPAEETFPYWGRIEFVEPEGGGRITAGRAQTWRADYEARVRRHRAEIRAETDRLSWSFTIHRTDRPASELLLALHARIGGGLVDERTAHARKCPAEGIGMIGGLPLGFAEPLVLIGLLTLPVLWWLLRLIPPRPRRIDFPPTRLLLEIAPREETPARTPWWLTRHAASSRRSRHPRRRGPAVEPAADDDDGARADRDPHRRRLGRGRYLGRALAHRRRHHIARGKRSSRGGAHSALRRHARHFVRAPPARRACGCN